VTHSHAKLRTHWPQSTIIARGAIGAKAGCCVHPICGHPVVPSWALSWCTACTVTDNAIIGLYMAVELCNLEGTKRLGSIADPPNFDSLHSPEECSIASIYLSILSQPAASFLLNSSFATSILTHPSPLLLLAIPRCPSTCIHSPSHRATAQCPMRLLTLKPNPSPLLRGLLRPHIAEGHPRARIS